MRGGEPKAGSSIHWNKKQPLCAHGSREGGTVYLLGKCSLISVP